MTSRSQTGGYEARFDITRTDDQPIPPNRRYMVLSFDGSDPEAVVAIGRYADLIEQKNPALAADIRSNLINPAAAPAQHRWAK